jgi:hypothetical protein
MRRKSRFRRRAHDVYLITDFLVDMYAKYAVFMRSLVTLLMLPPEACDTTSAARYAPNQCLPKVAPVPRNSVRFSSRRCLSAATEIFLRPTSLHIPTSRLHNAPFRYVLDKSRTAWNGDGSAGCDLFACTCSMKRAADSVLRFRSLSTQGPQEIGRSAVM